MSKQREGGGQAGTERGVTLPRHASQTAEQQPRVGAAWGVGLCTSQLWVKIHTGVATVFMRRGASRRRLGERERRER